MQQSALHLQKVTGLSVDDITDLFLAGYELRPPDKEVTTVPEFHEGELIIYQNGDYYEIGKIKRLTPTGAFVWYSEGDTAAKTPFECMHKLINSFVIKESTLGDSEAKNQ